MPLYHSINFSLKGEILNQHPQPAEDTAGGHEGPVCPHESYDHAPHLPACEVLHIPQLMSSSIYSSLLIATGEKLEGLRKEMKWSSPQKHKINIKSTIALDSLLSVIFQYAVLGPDKCFVPVIVMKYHAFSFNCIYSYKNKKIFETGNSPTK